MRGGGGAAGAVSQELHAPGCQFDHLRARKTGRPQMAAPVAGPVAQRIERPPPKGTCDTKNQTLKKQSGYESVVCALLFFKDLTFFLASFWRAVKV